MVEYVQQIKNFFRNKTLNAAGVERSLYELLEDGDVVTAISLMQNRDDEVENAIKEYNPQTHDVMNRPNKSRKNANEYETEKLPRSRQRYINEVELFFLLGSGIKWRKDKGDDETFAMFEEFLKKQRFSSRIREIKRLAGAETESASLYHIYEENNAPIVKNLVLARSTGYQLRPMFDQYNNMVAFAYGYKLKEYGKTVQHWDIQTPEFLFYCKKGALGWEVETFENPTGKINVVYYRQRKSWDGVEQRLHREEMLDSKVADTNNYFADPIAAATADVVQMLADNNAPAKLIQMAGGASKFEYINPPQNSESRKAEKEELKESILFDTFTPDLSFEALKGMGSLSGVAIKNAMILGYIKRDNLKETYGELIDREKSIILGILKYLHPDKAKLIDELEISFEFEEPFADDKTANWTSIAQLYTSGVVSLDTAVNMLSLAEAPEEEIQKIKESKNVVQEQNKEE